MKRWIVAITVLVVGGAAGSGQEEAGRGVGTWTAVDRHGERFEIEVFAGGTVRVLKEDRRELVLNYKWLDEKRARIELPFRDEAEEIEVAISGDEMTLTDSQGRKLVCRRSGRPVDKAKTLGRWIVRDSYEGIHEIDVSGDGTIRVTGDREGTLRYRWLDARRVRVDAASIGESWILDVALFGDEMTLSDSQGRMLRCRRWDAGAAESARISRNEREASASLQKIATAQADFRSNDRDGNRVQDYWTGDVAGLYSIEASGRERAYLKLIELSIALADDAPWTEGLRFGGGNAYSVAATSFGKRAPKAGYWFRMIPEYTVGGGDRHAYRTNTGGAKEATYHPSRFAVCAFPAEYGKSGKKTFILSENCFLFWKDTGGKPVDLWPSDEDLEREWTFADERDRGRWEYDRYMRKEAEERRKKEEERRKAGFHVDPWTSWNRVGEGSFVEFELISDYGGGSTKMIQRKILRKKGEEHVLDTETVIVVADNEMKSQAEEKVYRTREGAGAEMECVICKRKGCTGNQPKWTEEVLTVDGRRISCAVMEFPERNCRGEANSFKGRTWYSNDVPGQLVRTENEAGGNKMQMILRKFAVKK